MKTNLWTLTLIVVAAWNAAGQTAVDLSRQGKLGTGTTLPARCTVGQVFFNTAAPSGTNLYACTTPNNWVSVGMPSLAGDAAGTQQTLTVKGIQGRPVSAASPADQNVLRFNASTSQWEPGTLPAIGTGAPPATCAAGNLYLQHDTANNLQQLYICTNTDIWTMTGAMSGLSSQRPASCITGQTWISTDTPALSYCTATGNPGTWTAAGAGPQGAVGPQGPAGPGGNTLLSGTGAPFAGTGANGDFYLNTVAACLYGPKTAGAWPSGCTSLTSGSSNFNINSGNATTGIAYSALGLAQTTVEPMANLPNTGNVQAGFVQDNYLSGLQNPADYGNLVGAMVRTWMYNGRNASDNSDKKTMTGFMNDVRFLGAGQHSGYTGNIFCVSVGDCLGGSDNITVANYVTAAGDEGNLVHSADIFQFGYSIDIPVTAVTNTGCVSTLTASVVKSTGPTDYKTFPVSSTSGCVAGQWITIDQGNSAVDTVQVKSVGSGTLTVLLQAAHASGAPIAPAVRLANNNGWLNNQFLGQGRIWINMSATPVVTGNVDVSAQFVTAHGGANFTTTMVGGDTNLPGCIAYPAQDVPFQGASSLAANIDAITTTVNVYDGSRIANYESIWIASEQMLVKSGGFTNTLTVVRGYNGTAPVPHNQNDGISLSLRSWYPIQSTSGGNAIMSGLLASMDTTVNAIQGPTLTAADYVVRPCGKAGALELSYGTTTELAAAVVLESNSFTWNVNDLIRQSVPPFSSIEAIYQAAIQEWDGPSVRTNNGMFKAVNLGHNRQMGSAFFMDGSGGIDDATHAGYTYGLWMVGNTARGSINVGGIDLSGIGLSFTTGLGDHKQINWGGPGGSALIYPETTDFVIDAYSTGKLKLRNTNVGTGNDVVLDYSGNTSPVTLTLPQQSGALAVNVGGTVSRNIPGDLGSTIEIGNFSGGTGQNTYVVYAASNQSVSHMWQFAMPYASGGGNWMIVAPTSSETPLNAPDFQLEAKADGSATQYFRLRGVGSGGSGVTLTIYQYGGGSSVFTPTNATSGQAALTAYLPSTGLTIASHQVQLPGAKATFATLGAAPAAGTFVYCTDCTTAPACAGSGTGHMAVSNGNSWTCQ